jgi:alpha-beta hydrolase superfamily lysophospholipase
MGKVSYRLGRDWGKKVSDGRTPFDWLSRDHDEVDKYVADPLCGWDASVGLWLGLFDLIFAGADDRTLARIRRATPINLVGGTKDPATDLGNAVEKLATRMARLGFSNLKTTIYEETRHESLNELNRDVITREFADWAEMVARQAGPSAAR